MRPTTQFRFVQTTMTAAPGLKQDVKYIASYRMDDGKLAVLAQGQDKFTLKKWGVVLSVRPCTVSPVDDMNKALEFARSQDGFQDWGRFTCCKNSKVVGQPASARRSMPPPASKTQQESPKKTQQEPGKSGNDEEEFRIPKKEEYNTPGHVQAREWVQERLKYEQQKEAMTAMLMADYVEVDVDIDRVRPTMSLEEMRLHDIATTRRHMIEQLRYMELNGELTNRNIIPRGFRAQHEAWNRERMNGMRAGARAHRDEEPMMP